MTAGLAQAKREMMEVHLAHTARASKRDSAPDEQPGLLPAKAGERKFSAFSKRATIRFSDGKPFNFNSRKESQRTRLTCAFAGAPLNSPVTNWYRNPL